MPKTLFIITAERSKWKEKCRDGLEYVLMKKAYEDSRISIHCYGTQYENKRNFIDDIKSCIDNHDLVDLYTSLGKIQGYRSNANFLQVKSD